MFRGAAEPQAPVAENKLHTLGCGGRQRCRRRALGDLEVWEGWAFREEDAVLRTVVSAEPVSLDPQPKGRHRMPRYGSREPTLRSDAEPPSYALPVPRSGFLDLGA